MHPYLKLAFDVAFTIALMFASSCICLLKQIIPARYRSKSVRDELVLITGAGNGIGRLLTLRFAKLGARLILVDIDERNNEQTKRNILSKGGYAEAFTCDLSKRDDIYRVADEIKSKLGSIQILINNAGVVTGKTFLDSSDSSIDKIFQVNTMSHFWMCKAFLPYMIENNHGHVVSIASMAGLFGTAGLSDYCASKFAVVGFDESLRNELVRQGKTGVKTTVVCPFYINTGMFEGVKSPIVPLLEPDYAADKIVEAVLTNQPILLMPRLMYLIYFFKGFISSDVENYVTNKALKTNHCMDEFVGRKKS